MECHNSLAAGPQLVACPLTQFYEEWHHTYALSEWMDKTLRLDHSIQFYHVPPPFSGIKEINLSSQEETDSLSKEIQDLLLKQALDCSHS